MEERNAARKISLKTRTVTPYWHYLRPIFQRYDLDLAGPPYEVQVKKVIEKWLKEQDIELETRQGHNIDVVDFEFAWEDLRIGIETKGHSNHPHNLTRMMDQLKRYLTHVNFLIVIVHCPGLKAQIERFTSVWPKKLQRRILIFKLAQLDSILFQLTERIEEEVGSPS